MTTKVKPLGNYVSYKPVYKDQFGDILLASNVSEGEKDYAETGIVTATGDAVKYVKQGDEVILDQYSVEPVWINGETIYLHKEDRLKGIINAD